MKNPIIRDDKGVAWELVKGRIRVVLDRSVPDGGYVADSWEEAVQLLNKYGYITRAGKF